VFRIRQGDRRQHVRRRPSASYEPACGTSAVRAPQNSRNTSTRCRAIWMRPCSQSGSADEMHELPVLVQGIEGEDGGMAPRCSARAPSLPHPRRRTPSSVHPASPAPLSGPWQSRARLPCGAPAHRINDDEIRPLRFCDRLVHILSTAHLRNPMRVSSSLKGCIALDRIAYPCLRSVMNVRSPELLTHFRRREFRVGRRRGGELFLHRGARFTADGGISPAFSPHPPFSSRCGSSPPPRSVRHFQP